MTRIKTRPALAIFPRIFPGGRFAAFVTWFLEMRSLARQRRQLAELNDAQLKDIGVSRADVARELARPFWRV